MMRLVYDSIFIVFALCYLPFFILRLFQAESKRRLLCDRFGCIPDALTADVQDHRIWIHAVSVGEVIAVKQLIDQLIARFPQSTIFLSTVTPTGFSVAKKKMHASVRLLYVPFDISFLTTRVMRAIKPALLVLVETELWPNLIRSAHRAGARICIVNGRLSPRSFRRYYPIKIMMAGITKLITCAIVQTERYKKRFVRLGFTDDAVMVVGTMKYDMVAESAQAEVSGDQWRQQCGFPAGAPVFIAASTHDNEEDLCMDAFRRLQKAHPLLRLLIAPRHINRTKSLALLAQKKGLRIRCAVAIKGIAQSEESDVYFLNTIGQLSAVYQYGDIVFMGGSLIEHGGQNPLEAVIHKKPVLSGPHYVNFQDVYTDLVECHGAVIVPTLNALHDELDVLLRDKGRCARLAEAAHALLESKKGAVKRTVDILDSLIRES